MGRTLVFDLETDGLLDQLTRIHSLCLKDVTSGETWSCTDDDPELPSVQTGLDLLASAATLIGHNIQNFDIPAIQKVFPGWSSGGTVRDTLILSRLVWSDIKDADFRKQEDMRKHGKEWIDQRLFGAHSLESWGQRLGLWKGDYGQIRKEEGKALGLTGDALMMHVWGSWSPAMQEYCEQDVEVTEKLWLRILSKLPDGEDADCIELEHRVRAVVDRQEAYGFLFDRAKAEALHATLLQRKAELDGELQTLFAPWYRSAGEVTPAADRAVKRSDLDFVVTERRFGKTGRELAPYVGPVRERYIKGGTYTKVALRAFNPGSRKDIEDRLRKLRGWVPTEFTDGGDAKLNDEILQALPYPEAQALAEYFMIQKRLGQLSDGTNAWLRKVQADGRIRGRVNTNGAYTGRMTHFSPNIAQVPGIHDKKTGALLPYGKECRELFTVPKGKLLVGCDADALELRNLAGYMARHDDGAYIRTVLEGNKANGTDMHSINAKALGCSRDVAKVWFYAFIYGAGNKKLGFTLGARTAHEAGRLGARSRRKFLTALPALKTLVDRVSAKVTANGCIRGLDGRIIRVRSAHAALNTLLQSAGAIIMKRALVIADDDLQSAGLVPGVNYEFTANVHDELQVETDEDKADIVGNLLAEAIRKAGRYYNFACPQDAQYGVGKTWADTH